MTYFTARSTLLHNAFVWENAQTLDIIKTIEVCVIKTVEVCELKIGTNS